jgi:subtilase family serine protease
MFAVLVSASLACLAAAPPEQFAAPATPRIEARVDEARLVMLRGNTRPEARAEFDRGPVASNLVMGDLVLVLRRSAERQAAFDVFLASQYDKSSPNFHHWLTPDEIGQQFGPAQADIDTISQWLQNHGLGIESVAKDRMTIRFSGMASQVTGAFHTEIHNLQVRGEDHIANMTDPSIPEALAPVVVGVKALHNFFPHPLHRLGAEVRRNAQTGKWERISSPAAVPSRTLPAAPNAREVPLFNTGGATGGAANIEDIGPYDFAAIYNVLPLWNASTAVDGTGQTIAIAGTSDINLTDVDTFRRAFGLPYVSSTYPTYKAPTIIDTNTPPGDCPSGASNCFNDVYENTLDVEWSGAIAKNAKIILVASSASTATTDPLYLSEKYIVDNVTAPIMNVSYGECELGLAAAGNTEYNNLWSTAEMAGIAVFVSSGDEGSASCDAGLDSSVPYGAQFGLSVSGIASTPHDTAVGGTDFNWLNNQSTYWGTSNNSTNLSSALGYIPEFPWNSTCANSLLDSEINSALKESLSATQICDEIGIGQITSGGNPIYSLVDVVGGSGGKSSCIDGDGATVASCTKGYTKPTWQAGVTGIPSDGVRDIPDVSFFSANGFSGSSYVVCVSVAGTCSYTAGTEPTGEEIGGTSVASPIMAGVMALINQKAGALQGNPNTVLYGLAAKESYSGCSSESVGLTGSNCIFYDVDTGTNAMPCDTGSPDCSGTDVYGVLSGYAATAGYDLATGLGSVNVANLVNAFAGQVAPAVTLSGALTFASTAEGSVDPTTQTISVKNTGGGDALKISGITITGANSSSFSETNTCGSSLVGGATCNIVVTFKPAAIGTLTASVSVADNATGSPQTVSLTGIGAELGSYSLAASAVTIAAPSTSGTSTVTATAVGGYTGTITLTCSVAPLTGGVDTPTCSGSTITVASGQTTATGTITLSTTAAASAAASRNVRADASEPGIRPWIGASGAALACVLLVGIPARRRGWKAWLGVFLLMASFGGVLVGCGGGGSKTPPPVSAPVVTTGADSAVTTTGATLAGTVNPNDAATSAWFLYGTSSTLAGGTQTTSQSVGSGSTASNLTATLTGLTPGTKYYYQAQASNSGGTGSGVIDSFTTGSTGTTTGAYTVTVTGTDTNGVSQTTTFTLTVQ